MSSPFPGMNPYIEACGLWGDFHHNLIHEIQSALAAAASDRYLVRTEERSYVVLLEDNDEVKHPFIPDVKVTAAKRRNPSRKGGTAVAEPPPRTRRGPRARPLRMRTLVEEPFRETYVAIYEAGPGQRLVTSVEVLSPSNKRPGAEGWHLYLRKRQALFLGGVNLVEIDLLRGGQRLPMLDPWPDSPYTILVSRARNSGLCDVWPAHFREPLPLVSVPLARPDPDLTLDLRPLIDVIYRRGRYGRSIDYHRPLSPPVAEEDRAWLTEYLRALPATA